MSTDRNHRLLSNPMDQFARWYQEARKRLALADAMCLSTVTLKGRPSARMVLLKGLENGGFSFFTNFQSPKAKELSTRPYAALTFYWQPLGRQVRIEGKVSRTTKKEADAYFATRPRLSQIGSWASQQSRPLESRQELFDRFKELLKKYEERPVPAPNYWQGFRVIPDRIEFWQEGPNRMHDRWVYQRSGRRWRIVRLNP